MKNHTEFDVITSSAGTCIITICPQMMLTRLFVPFTADVINPFCAGSASITNLVYNGARTIAGPFHSQSGNLVGYLPDMCKTLFRSS